MTTNETPELHINSFVRRQTPESRFSHSILTDSEILSRVQAGWSNRQQGYREGVALVRVPPVGFYSSVVRLNEGDALAGTFEARREGESPRKTLTVVYNTTNGNESITAKMPAEQVDIVLYASTVLSEDGDNQLPATEGNWEIISINASPETGDVPIHPQALMHNHFGSDGGTDTALTNDEFVAMLQDSFVYWKDKALIGG